jgi:hypothetical protein
MLHKFDQERRDNFIAGMRKLLDWMEDHPNMPAPSSMDTANIYAITKERLIQLRRDCGLRDKLHEDPTYDYAGFKKEFSPEVRLHLFVKREEVCRRVQVGEKVVPATPETIVRAREQTVETVYAWQCDDPLLSPETVADALLAEHAEAQAT